MTVKNALAFKIILESCDQVGDNLQENWKDVLWCVSRWELMYQTTAGGPTDASFFATANEVSKRLDSELLILPFLSTMVLPKLCIVLLDAD